MRLNLLKLALVAVLAAALPACPRSSGAPAGRTDEETFVQVENRAFLDANVFVLRGGQRIRLGLVNGSSTKTFSLPSRVMFGTTSLSFQMDFIGSSRAPLSEAITVVPGDTVVLAIPPQ